ncbi:unnamed protein product [Trichogramma brassicae]|uniref:Uncharacterized protein n=1 Tax=Trichogramma brassicae TaxID=86971 RepID=A0A6H5IPX0_9HYME|nr:unnamed protein product [Trichogramma brassicae]
MRKRTNGALQDSAILEEIKRAMKDDDQPVDVAAGSVPRTRLTRCSRRRVPKDRKLTEVSAFRESVRETMSVYKNEFVGCHLHQQKFDSLRSIREKVNWNIEEERHVFVGQLNCLFIDWKCQYQAEEIDWLLTESISFRDEEGHNRSGELIIKFVANSGYKYQSKIEQDGKPLERRTTALHHVARSGFLNKDIMVRELFKIYNNFEVNYTDSSGLTHFHVACAIGCDDVVEKFLELGQDPNLLVHETGYSALHLALAYDRREVARLLLKSGACGDLSVARDSQSNDRVRDREIRTVMETSYCYARH